MEPQLELEEIKKENGLVYILDEEGLITVQLKQENVAKIVSAFDYFVQNKEDSTQILGITEEEPLEIEITLKHEDHGFNLTTVTTDDDSLFHDFELEYCNKEVWDKIKELVS